jgi:hypothetical protein
MSAVEIHRELCTAVYSHVRQWCRMLKDGRTKVHDEEQSGWQIVASDDLVQNVDQKICERRHFTISELSREFPRISRTLLCEISTVRLGCHKLCTRWVLKVLTGAHKMQRMASALNFLEQYHKDGDEFLNHIIQVTDDETWVSFVNAETKEQSKQWMHTHSPNKLKTFKQTFARKLMITVGQEKSADGGIHATRDHSVRSVVQNMKEKKL